MRKLLWILVLVVPSVVGCLAEGDDLATRTSELEACPDSVAEGVACRAEDGLGLACEREGDVLCYCDRDVGAWRCEVVAPPPPDPCPADLREGTACERVGASCTRTCDGAETCRCVGGDGTVPRDDGSTDPAAEGAIWICEGEPPPPPTGEEGCTDEWFARCEGGMTDPADPTTEAGRCVSADGTVCWCEVGPEGRGIAHCEGGEPPPPPPAGTECTDELRAACEAGVIADTDLRCVSPDGTICWCERAAGGDRGAVVCEGGGPVPVPGTDECTDEHYAACEAGAAVECSRGDLRCRCEVTAEGRALLICG